MKTAGASLMLSIVCLLTGDSQNHSTRFREVSIAVGRGPRWISVADVNHDGNPDILVANSESETVSVLLGNGAGQFHEAPGSPVPAGHLPNDIAIVDMNGDGNPDLVIADHQSPYLRVLLGDGKGGFTLAPGSPVDVHSDPHPHGVAVADFNGDGKPDVVTDSWGKNQIELLLGDGTGRLVTPGRYFAVGHRPYERLRSADFNRDGVPDVATTNLDDDTATILLGDGKGGFRNAPGSPFAAGAKPWQMFVGDLDGDGNLDLAVIPYQRDITSVLENAVTVLLGDGRGSFRPMDRGPLSLEECRGANSVSAGDLTGDGNRAIVVACAESRTMMLFERPRGGRFAASSIPIKGGWGGVTIAKLTHDRYSEVLTANADDGTITLYFPQ
jgi:FG-GAP-like repeat